MNRNSRERVIKYDVTLTDEQKEVKAKILDYPFTFLTGKAGSAKTFLACAVALDQLFKGEINKIVITRPTVSTDDIGFLPGTLEEKMDPWLMPIRENFRRIYNKKDQLDKLEHDGKIQILPLTYFRGTTFSDTVCILDEFQNCTTNQLSMCIGRLGLNSRMIFCGDDQQIDLRNKKDSAIFQIDKLKDSEFVYHTELLTNHRHPAVFDLLERLK